MECPVRKYPLRRPDNHKPPIPRWLAEFPDTLDKVFTAYIGVQSHTPTNQNNQNTNTTGFQEILTSLETWLSTPTHAPSSTERFRVLSGHDVPDSLVFVCYWASESRYLEAIDQLNLPDRYRALDPEAQQTTGLWCERFVSHLSRLETNYTGTDYLPGLARLPGTGTRGHDLTGYWGAARDRIPGSGWDGFEGDLGSGSGSGVDRDHEHESGSESLSNSASKSTSRVKMKSRGKYLIGTNTHNLTHIRSGQFWKHCDEAERRSYEEKLEPTLREGLAYLWRNPVDTGSMALRYLVNVPASSDSSSSAGSASGSDPTTRTTSTSTPSTSDSTATNPPHEPESSPSPKPKQETNQSNESSVTAFFRTFSDLETWAKRHPSHLAIYAGAIRHAKTFGAQRKFRTWHEVSVLRAGEARFEYLNCGEGTGMIMSEGEEGWGLGLWEGGLVEVDF